MKIKLLTLLLTVISFVAGAQTNTGIVGQVNDGEGKPLAGVNIKVIATNLQAQTDDAGKFKLITPAGKYKLLFSAVGYKKTAHVVDVKEGQLTNRKFELHSSETSLNEVGVKSKTGIKQVKESPFNVTVLDAKAAHNSSMDLAHLLDRSSGVKIRETGGVGSDMNITLNGFTGRNVRVFIDGVPMQGMGSAFQLNNIPVNMAERIEIYKGVVPIEFGADALGGVINIVTNRSKNTSVDLSYSYGSFNTHRTSALLNHTFKNGFSLQLNAFQNYSDNNYKIKTPYRIFGDSNENQSGWSSGSAWSTDSIWTRRFHDTYRNETVLAKLGIVGKKWADQFLLGFTYGQVNRDVQNGADMRFVYGERTTSSKSFLPSLVYEKRNLLVKGLYVRLNANYNYEKAGSVDTSAYKYSWNGQRKANAQLRGVPSTRGEASYGVTEFANSNASGTLNVGYRISNSHSIGINNNISGYTRKPDIEAIALDLAPELPTLADSMSRSSLRNILGVEYRYSYKQKWTTNIFAKHYLNRVTGPGTDVNSATYERTETASQIGYGIATTYFIKSWQLKASVERAYRLPNDRELFGDEILEVGNIGLRPEQSNNYNIGFTLNKSLSKDYSLYIDWAGYFRDTYDFIQQTLGVIGDNLNGTSVYMQTNHGRVTRLGTDAEARLYYKNKFAVGGTITYMDIKDKTRFLDPAGTNPNGNYGSRMPNQPFFFWNADVNYYAHDLFAKGNTLNLTYTLNFMDRIYRDSEVFGYAESRAVIPRQMYSNFSATYIMQNGKYNVSFEARNLENALLYDNFSLQRPGRNFSVKLRYYFNTRRK